jgi:hypothetical protein
MQRVEKHHTIRYFRHDEINCEKWDRCIALSVNTIIYGYSWYLDIVCDEWDGLVLGDYDAVFPLPMRKKRGVSYIYTPPFTQQLGLFSIFTFDAAMVDAFLKAIPGRFLLAELMINNKSKPAKIAVKQRDNFELSLDASIDILRGRYSDNLKRNLKKAVQQNLSVAEYGKAEDIIDLFRANRGRIVPNLSNEDYLRLSHLYYSLYQKGMAKAYGVFNHRNELIAGAVFFFEKQRIIFIFSGTTHEAKEKGAMPMLIDNMIEKYASSETIFDFEGSMDRGLARFYKSFGASVNSYWFWQRSKIPGFLLAVLKRLKY